MQAKRGSRGLTLILLCCGLLLSGCDRRKHHRDDDDYVAERPGGGGHWPRDAGADDDDAGLVADPARPIVNVEGGDVEGVFDGEHIYSFRGIPYAAPPVGDLRWAAPRAPQPWSGVRPAKANPKRCAQRESALYQSARSEDEDCLYVNVWTPSLKPRRLLPVMVWLHGGAHTSGSISEPVPYSKSGAHYDGAALAGKGVVVVSVNYRLGALGFFGLPGDGSALRNQGLWDQQFALQWVKENIVGFGGDHRNVTLFGQASGAVDVCLHMVSRHSRGSFHQAIGQSGGCTTRTPEEADVEAETQQWIERVGCASKADTLKCLRQKPVKDLLDATPLSGGPFTPVVDGDFLFAQPRSMFNDADVARVPYMLGSNSDEGTIYTSNYGYVDSKDKFHEVLSDHFPDSSLERLCELYPHKNNAANPFQASLARAFGDAYWTCSTRETAVYAEAASLEVYLYSFDMRGPVASLGAAQGTEVGYVFGSAGSLSSEERRVADHIQRYWTNFAKTGDPNEDKLTTWPRYTTRTDYRLNISLEIKAVQWFHKDECDFWHGEYARACGEVPE